MRVDGVEKPVMIEGALREASRIKSAVTDSVEDTARMAARALKQGRRAAEDALHEAEHTIKQKPFQSMGVILVAGILAGSCLALLAFRRR